MPHILHDLAVRRSLIRIGEDIVNTAYDAPTEKTSKEQIAEAEKALYGVGETTNMAKAPWISTRRCGARWKSRKGRQPAAGGFPA